jgi:hypothetical protein
MSYLYIDRFVRSATSQWDDVVKRGLHAVNWISANAAQSFVSFVDLIKVNRSYKCVTFPRSIISDRLSCSVYIFSSPFRHPGSRFARILSVVYNSSRSLFLSVVCTPLRKACSLFVTINFYPCCPLISKPCSVLGRVFKRFLSKECSVSFSPSRGQSALTILTARLETIKSRLVFREAITWSLNVAHAACFHERMVTLSSKTVNASGIFTLA